MERIDEMRNGRLPMVYSGKIADDMTKRELLEAIYNEAQTKFPSNKANTMWAMEEAFRCGFLSGEEFSANA